MPDDMEEDGRTVSFGFGRASVSARPDCGCSASYGGNLPYCSRIAPLCLFALSISPATVVGYGSGAACDISGWPRSGGKATPNYYRASAIAFPLDESGRSVHAANREGSFGDTGVLDCSGSACSFLGTLFNLAGNSRNYFA